MALHFVTAAATTSKPTFFTVVAATMPALRIKDVSTESARPSLVIPLARSTVCAVPATGPRYVAVQQPRKALVSATTRTELTVRTLLLPNAGSQVNAPLVWLACPTSVTVEIKARESVLARLDAETRERASWED